MNGVFVGKDAIIGAGSVVKEHFKVPSRKIAVGNPAKIVKEINDAGKQRVVEGLKRYQALPERYRSGARVIKT